MKTAQKMLSLINDELDFAVHHKWTYMFHFLNDCPHQWLASEYCQLNFVDIT